MGFIFIKYLLLRSLWDLKQSYNEITFKLEQLRAVDNNIKIDVIYSRSIPVGVDTKEDYMEIKKLMEYKS